MKFKVPYTQYIDIDISNKELINGCISLLTARLRHQNNQLSDYEWFYKNELKFFGGYEIATSHRSDVEDDITSKLSANDKELIEVILYLTKM